MDRNRVASILSELEEGYDLISEKFSQTRKSFWRDLELIQDYARDGDRVLDFGCGNGRLLELIGDKRIEYVGVDVSEKLLGVAGDKWSGPGRRFQKISGSDRLPFPDGYFNIVYAVAVFHHLPGEELRREVTNDLKRVLKPGGLIIITVWDLWQRKYVKYILQNWIRKFAGQSRLDWNDCNISFTDNRGRVFWRYHHAFRMGELVRLLKQAGFKIEQDRKIGRNLVVIAQKT